MTSRIVILSVWFYEVLLLGYPRRFRKRFGSAMLGVFEESCYAAFERGGHYGVMTLWYATAFDLIRSTAAERISNPSSGRFMTVWVPGVLSAAAATALQSYMGGSAFVFVWAWLLVLPIMAVIAAWRFSVNAGLHIADAVVPLAFGCLFGIGFMFLLASALPVASNWLLVFAAFRWIALPSMALWMGSIPLAVVARQGDRGAKAAGGIEL